ncbi:MAG TPA: hypothetical protein VGB78_02505 [Thermoplasmata archaeon]
MSREQRGGCLTLSRVLAAIALSALLALPSVSSAATGRDELHFLDYSEDNYKVAFIADNLTAAVTYSWPQCVFEHNDAMLSPDFVVGLPLFYLYNDTDSDGTFDQSEISYVGYLDENHVNWNWTAVQFYDEPDPGEYVVFRMNTTVSLYPGLLNETVVVRDWANVTFFFRINEHNVSHENSYGDYEIVGMTELQFNFTIDISRNLNVSGLAMEQTLKGGGSTYLFLLLQSGSHGNTIYEHVSGRVDEKDLYGENYSREFYATTRPTQDIYFAKDDGTVQAFYRWDSEPRRYVNESVEEVVPMNATYFTTGAGLIVQSAFSLSNLTTGLYFEGSLGIEESGFIVRIGDWFEDNLVLIIIIVGSVSLLIAVSVAFHILKGRRSSTEAPAEDSQVKKDQG